MEYSGLFELEKRLDASLESHRPLVVVGPGGIGKSGRISAWAERKKLNAYKLVEGVLDPYQSDTEDGILLLDHPMPKAMGYQEYIRQIFEDRDALVEKVFCHLDKHPNILFTVITFSEYPDSVEVVQAFMKPFCDKPDWDIVRLDYDKREQLSYFIKYDEEAIESLSTKKEREAFEERKKEYAQYLESHPLPKLDEIISTTKLEKEFLEYLLNCEEFDTKPGIVSGEESPGLNNFRLGQALTTLFSTRREIEENIGSLLQRDNVLSWSPRIRQMCDLLREFLG